MARKSSILHYLDIVFGTFVYGNSSVAAFLKLSVLNQRAVLSLAARSYTPELKPGEYRIVPKGLTLLEYFHEGSQRTAWQEVTKVAAHIVSLKLDGEDPESDEEAIDAALVDEYKTRIAALQTEFSDEKDVAVCIHFAAGVFEKLETEKRDEVVRRASDKGHSIENEILSLFK